MPHLSKSNTPFVVDDATPLAGSTSYVSSVVEVAGYASVAYFAFADENSAASGVLTQWSVDGTNWDLSDATSFTTGSGALSVVGPPKARYFRVTYVNGVTPQTFFRSQIVCTP